MENSKNNTVELTTDLLIAKMIQSKADGRLAIITKIDSDEDVVYLNMDRIGARKFPTRTVNHGFNFLTTNEEVIKAWFYTYFSVRKLFNPKSLYETACEIYDSLNKTFDDMTMVEVANTLKGIVDEADKKAGL